MAAKKVSKKKIAHKEAEWITVSSETSDFASYIDFITSPWKTFLFNFIRGTGYGLGILIGASIVVAILTYTAQQLYELPAIGDYLKKGVQSVEHVSVPTK